MLDRDITEHRPDISVRDITEHRPETCQSEILQNKDQRHFGPRHYRTRTRDMSTKEIILRNTTRVMGEPILWQIAAKKTEYFPKKKIRVIYSIIYLYIYIYIYISELWSITTLHFICYQWRLCPLISNIFTSSFFFQWSLLKIIVNICKLPIDKLEFNCQ